MRILFDYRPALRERTGVGEYVHEAANALVATAPADESLTLFSASWKDRLAPDVVPGAHTVDRAVPVKLLNLLWHRAEWPPVDWLAGAFDVAQAAHPLLLPTKRAARLVTIYDLDFLDHPERTDAEIRRDYPALAGSHARRADQVVVISEHTARDVEARLGVPRSHISVCVPGSPAWPRRDREPGEHGCLLFLGTLGPRKNLGVLLDAYERLIARRPASPPLVLAGRATPEAAPLIERAKRTPLAGRVEILGYVEPDQRRALFDRALVFVLPSHTEGFGLPAVEAMMAGVPVVASNRGALPEAVGAAGRLVDPGDAEGLGVALEEILSDRALRDRMSDQGRAHAEHFTWTRTAHGIRDAWALALEHRGVAMDDRRLHIGVDGRELVGRPTGVGLYLRHVLQEWRPLDDRSHRITVFLHAEPPAELVASCPGMAWQVEADPTGGTLWEQTRLRRAAGRAGLDVFFAGAYTAPLGLACPFVVLIHDVSFFAHPEWFRPRERLRRQWLTRSAARRARSILTVSEFSAGEIVRWLRVGRDRIHLAPPGEPDTGGTATEGRREPLVLFVGSLFNRRHIPDLIAGFAKAYSRVPHARLALVGDNRTHPPIDPMGLAADLGVASEVEWRAYISDAERDRLYGAARVFAFLSDYEGFAMTPMEALAHGVPSVLLDTPVAREVYGDGAELTAATPEAIGAALTRLLTDDRAHSDVLAAGRRRLAALSWTRTAATIRTCLEQAARAR